MNEHKASRYHRLRRRTSILLLIVSALFLSGLLLSGGSVALREAVDTVAPQRPLAIAIFTAILCLGYELLTLPLSGFGAYVLDHRYGLVTQSVGGWLRDRARAVLVELALAIAAAQVVYYAFQRWPAAWWAIAAVAFSAATILLAQLAPVLLLPLFYRFAPLERASLRERLVALSEKAGVRVLGVYEWGLGAKTRRANAALVGTGGTRRILVSDTLLAEYSEDEIEVILAHEIAHHVYRDLVASLAIDFGVLLTALLAAHLVLRASWSSLQLESPGDLAGMPLLLLVIGGVTVAAAPLVNAVSRKHERRADRFALELTGQPAAFISAMRRLAAQNLAEEQPSRLTLWLFHTHPPFQQRIAAARTYE